MSSLKDLAVVTRRLDELADELHAELTAGGIDFHKMVGVADDIARHADRLATAFSGMAEALDKSLDGDGTASADADADAPLRREAA